MQKVISSVLLKYALQSCELGHDDTLVYIHNFNPLHLQYVHADLSAALTKNMQFFTLKKEEISGFIETDADLIFAKKDSWMDLCQSHIRHGAICNVYCLLLHIYETGAILADPDLQHRSTILHTWDVYMSHTIK
jgi:hypothetical protein